MFIKLVCGCAVFLPLQSICAQAQVQAVRAFVLVPSTGIACMPWRSLPTRDTLRRIVSVPSSWAEKPAYLGSGCDGICKATGGNPWDQWDPVANSLDPYDVERVLRSRSATGFCVQSNKGVVMRGKRNGKRVCKCGVDY